MAFTPPDFAEIKAALLRDIANLAPSARLQDDSDWLARTNATASAVEGIYQHQAWIAQQIFPDTADADMLERHAQVRGLKRKAATSASGTLIATGTAGTAIAAGLILKADDEASYQITSAATLDSNGQASVAVSAITAGTAGNLDAGKSLTWQSPPSGVESTATVSSMVGGTDAETDASLLMRLLELIRRPPAGGNKYDYKRWALEVDGVSAAYIYPLRRGLGTVDIAITSYDGLPSAEIIAAAQTNIDDQRPVTAKDALVMAPTLHALDHHILITPAAGYTLAAATPYVVAAVTAYFADLAPGDSYVRSQLEKCISDLDCIADRQVVSPSGNIVATVNASQVAWLRAGTITVGLL